MRNRARKGSCVGVRVLNGRAHLPRYDPETRLFDGQAMTLLSFISTAGGARTQP